MHSCTLTLRREGLGPSHCGFSLGCYPFYKNDPFIFPDCPHVYFCGNTPQFGSKIFRGESSGDPRPGGTITRDSFLGTGLTEKASLESPGPLGLVA